MKPRELSARTAEAATFATAAIAALAAVLLVLSGCADTRGIAPTRTLAAPTGAAGSAAIEWPRADWWSDYGDAGLDALVARALDGTPSLHVAAARVRQAQATLEGAQAARQPQLALGAGATVQRFSEHGLVPPALAGATRWNSSLQLDASWELDAFGRQRAALAAAVGEWRAAQADAQAARSLLASQVAAAYFALARDVDQRAVAARTLQQRREVRALVQQRVAAGLETQIELHQAEGLVAQSLVDVEALDEAAARSRHALAELSGQRPDALAALAPSLAAVAPRALPAALPLDLLGRRADLVAQRWRVEAALREVDAARAQFYPNVNLLAFAGLSSLGLDRLVDFGSRIHGAGPALRLPVFDGGRLRAQLGARAAVADAAIESYHAALLRALREVADELASRRSIERQQQAQAAATHAAEVAYELALQRYRAGIGNFLVVLNAENNVLVQRRAASGTKSRALAADVALARALGGGFEADALPRDGDAHAATPNVPERP